MSGEICAPGRGEDGSTAPVDSELEAAEALFGMPVNPAPMTTAVTRPIQADRALWLKVMLPSHRPATRPQPQNLLLLSVPEPLANALFRGSSNTCASAAAAIMKDA